MGTLLLVILDHLPDVHPVDVIGTEHNDDIRSGLLDEVEVLVYGIGGSSVPLLARNRSDPALKKQRITRQS
jgi:hypothetical protein